MSQAQRSLFAEQTSFAELPASAQGGAAEGGPRATNVRRNGEAKSSAKVTGPAKVTRAATIACVSISHLPLQLALRDNPSSRNAPIVIIGEDKATAEIQHLNRTAERIGLRVGMRLNQARALVPMSMTLRAFTYPSERVEREVEDLLLSLSSFSPRVEKETSEVRKHGVFFLDPSGLRTIYGDIHAWAKAVRAYLTGRGFSARIVVGFDRNRARAIALGDWRPTETILASEEAEIQAVANVPLDRIHFENDIGSKNLSSMTQHKIFEALGQLEIKTVGDLQKLSRDALTTRFGEAVANIYERLCGRAAMPVQTTTWKEPCRLVLEIEPPDDDQTRLLFGVKSALQPVIARMKEHDELCTQLDIELEDTARIKTSLSLEPARPTNDLNMLIDLVRLKWTVPDRSFELMTTERSARGLETTNTARRFEEIRLVLHTQSAPREQLGIAQTGSLGAPDLHRYRNAAEGLARVRAAIGAKAVTRAVLREAHLPEANLEWAPVNDVLPPKRAKASSSETRLIRRLLKKPVPFDISTIDPHKMLSVMRVEGAAEARLESDRGRTLSVGRSDVHAQRHLKRVLRDSPYYRTSPLNRELADRATKSSVPAENVLLRKRGPYRVSGGWWARGNGEPAVERDYYFVETNGGEILWLFYDALKRQWFLQGFVD